MEIFILCPFGPLTHFDVSLWRLSIDFLSADFTFPVPDYKTAQRKVDEMSYFLKTRAGDHDEEQGEEDQYLSNQWIAFSSRVAIRIAIHPLEYAKVLIQVRLPVLFPTINYTQIDHLLLPQLGYEPMKPRMGKTLFGQPALLYPNVFQYGEWKSIRNSE